MLKGKALDTYDHMSVYDLGDYEEFKADILRPMSYDLKLIGFNLGTIRNASRTRTWNARSTWRRTSGTIHQRG